MLRQIKKGILYFYKYIFCFFLCKGTKIITQINTPPHKIVIILTASPCFQRQICAHIITIHSFTPRNSYSAVRLSTRRLTHIQLYLDAQDSAQLDQTNNKICPWGDLRTVSIETKYKYVVLTGISTTYLHQWLRANTLVSVRTYFDEYVVLKSAPTRA